MYWELVSHIWVLTGLKSAVNLSIADSSKKEGKRVRKWYAWSVSTKTWNCSASFCMELCCPKNQEFQNSGANYNHFRTWHDFSISQVSCKIKTVIENFFMLGSKFLQHTFLLLPSTELFLRLVTTLGSSSHSARVQHSAPTLLHNQSKM